MIVDQALKMEVPFTIIMKFSESVLSHADIRSKIFLGHSVDGRKYPAAIWGCKPVSNILLALLTSYFFLMDESSEFTRRMRFLVLFYSSSALLLPGSCTSSFTWRWRATDVVAKYLANSFLRGTCDKLWAMATKLLVLTENLTEILSRTHDVRLSADNFFPIPEPNLIESYQLAESSLFSLLWVGHNHILRN